MDNLTTEFDKIISDRKIDLPIRAAVNAGLKVLNRYYEKTDESIMGRAAMSKFFLLLFADY